MDSCVSAAMAEKRGPLAFMHSNYGQRTEARELKSFKALARHYRVKKTLVADMRYLKDIGASALTNKAIKMPKGRLKRSDVPSTYVPFRNAQLLSAAISWAEAIGAKNVYIGAVEEDFSGYPDCRQAFFKAFEKAARTGTRPGTKIRIITPLIGITKEEIVKTGIKLKAPLHLTWSCYKDSRLACGECDSCLLRLKGFEGSGMKDPVPYKRRKGK